MKNSIVHRQFHWFVEEAIAAGISRIMVLGAFGLGKTEQITIGYCLERIAKNPNIRIKIVSNTDINASDRVRSIKQYIENDDDFHKLAPNIKKTSVWGSSKLIVSRESISKDATVEAYGMFGSGIGGRADLIIFDDPQDLKTAVLEPINREKCLSQMENVWLSRLVEGGLAIVLMNRWHEKDLAFHIKSNPEWAWMEVAVSEDFSKLEITKHIHKHTEKYKIHPWKPPMYFMSKRADMGERNYNRGFRLIPYSDDEMYFPSFPNCCEFSVDRQEITSRIVKNTRDYMTVAGIDYASKKRPGTIITTVAMHKATERRHHIETVALRDASKLLEHMIRVRKQYNPTLWMAENNATQDLVNELLLNFTGLKGVNLQGFCTGKNKADPDMGLKSLENEFERGLWKFYFNDEPTIEDSKTNTYTRLYYEIRDYPFWDTTDIVMSLWFCREGINYMMSKMLRPNIW